MNCDRRIFVSRPRQGSMIIEAVIAIALLATAMIALGKLGSNAAAVSQQADHRLAATLAAENAIERLKNVPYESLQAESTSVAEAIEADSGYSVTIRVESFNVSQRDALHLAVQVNHEDRMPLTLHDWRFKPSAPDEPKSTSEPEPTRQPTDSDEVDDDA